MSSEIKADKWSPASGTSATIGDSGDTYTVPTGANFTVTDELKTNKISPASGTAFTMGDSGDTFTVPSGVTIANNGTATGFGDTAGVVLINATTASSGVSEVALTSVFSSTYEKYVVEVIGYRPSTSGYLLMRLGNSGGYVTSSTYYTSGFGKQDDNTNVDNYQTGGDKAYINPTSTRNDDHMDATFNVHVPTGVGAYKSHIYYTGAYIQNSGSKSTAFFWSNYS